MVRATDAFEAESSRVTLTTVVGSVVVVRTEILVEVRGVGGERPGHSWAICPFCQHLKHLPSFRSWSRLSSVSHLNGSQVWCHDSTIFISFLYAYLFLFLSLYWVT